MLIDTSDPGTARKMEEESREHDYYIGYECEGCCMMSIDCSDCDKPSGLRMGDDDE